MNLAALWSPIKHAVAEAFKVAAIYVPGLDGKPGLTLADIGVIVRWMNDANSDGTLVSNDEKHKAVAERIKERLNGRLPDWTVDMTLGFLFQYAKRKGLVS